MSAIQELSSAYDYNPDAHDYREWWDHHQAMMALTRHPLRRTRQERMVIGNGNRIIGRTGICLSSWVGNNKVQPAFARKNTA